MALLIPYSENNIETFLIIKLKEIKAFLPYKLRNNEFVEATQA